MIRFLPFEVIVGYRFLIEGRFQTVLTIFGAAVGVSVIVFMSALLAGVQTNIFNRVLSAQAHVVVTVKDDVARPLRDNRNTFLFPVIQKRSQRLRSIDQWSPMVRQIAGWPTVRSVAASIVGSGLVYRGETVKTVSMTGIMPDTFYGIVDLPSMIVQGSATLHVDTILIGLDLARNLGVSIGEKVRLQATGIAGVPTQVTFVVGGIFDMKNREANEHSIYVPLRAAQSLQGLPGGVTMIGVNLVDAYAADAIAAEISGSFDVKAVSWITTFADMFTALRSQDMANFVIRFFVAVAISLGIASVLVVSVVQRSHEIGILRAMGARRQQVLRVFLFQGAVVGLASSLVGSVLGYGFVLLWRQVAINADGTEFFPIAMPPTLFVLTAIIATITGLAASFIPALSAARLNPVDAIRG